MRNNLVDFINTAEFKDKKYRYKFYRVYLQCNYKNEKNCDKVV